MNVRWILGALTGVALAATLISCGGSDDVNETASSAAVPTATSAATTAAQPAERTAATATTAAAIIAATPAGPQVIEVQAADYMYNPKALTAKPGAISVTLSNSGPERPHTFAVKKLDGSGDIVRSERVPVGQSLTIDFTITEPGSYQIYCTLPGHADRGQTGSLTVTA